MTQPVGAAPVRSTTSTFLRALPAPACALAAAALLLWGRSYPGFPMAVAGLAVLATLGALALSVRPRPRGRGAVAALVAVGVLLGAGVAANQLVGDDLVQKRWSMSRAAFEAEVAGLPDPTSGRAGNEDGSFRDFPASCPWKLGGLRLSECWVIDGGYLFLQAPDALTDSAGIAYLPAGGRSGTDSLGRDGLTPLGGPWWAWTCRC